MALSLTRSAIVFSASAAAACLLFASCQMAGSHLDSPATGTASSTAPATAPASSLFGGKTTAQMGGAELWAQTCSHCHNLRDPSSYGPAQWEVAVYDMRVRANLTGDEQRKILEFLKAASQ